ncbi:DM13 domain-containing protein [Lyngbya aestuarii]|uniref:DM13 domain-containing protein n=1 Tax=Lyngbya aestuarii TaxID=118322 RepID=UPI00403E0B41
MKLNYLGIFGAIALLTASFAEDAQFHQTFASQLATSPVVSQATVPSGSFVAAEHPTKGMVNVVTENGQRYLEFDEDFKTDDGPDLFVLFHRKNPPQSYQDSDYVNLGPLQQVSGVQRYAIPADLEPAEFGSVVIWCRQFNATFGYAPLSR